MNGRPCKRVDLLYSNMKTTDAEHIVDIIATPICIFSINLISSICAAI